VTPTRVVFLFFLLSLFCVKIFFRALCHTLYAATSMNHRGTDGKLFIEPRAIWKRDRAPYEGGVPFEREFG
jgi:hypothetical protein